MLFLPLLLIISWSIIDTSAAGRNPDASGGPLDLGELNYIVALDVHGKGQGNRVQTPSKDIVMTGGDGARYLCHIPIDEPKLDEEDLKTEGVLEEETSDEEGQEDKAEELNPWAYLERLATICFSRHDRWWMYELCYGSSLSQFHVSTIKGEVDSQYVLGRFDPEAKRSPEIHEEDSNGKMRKYISEVFTSGDMCDETNSARQTEVRYYCEEKNHSKHTSLISITEGPTCQYVATLTTPLLCKHPSFKIEDPTRVILCEHLGPDSDGLDAPSGSNQTANDVLESVELHPAQAISMDAKPYITHDEL